MKFFRKKKEPIIRFHSNKENLDSMPHPVPAYKAMPEWFRKLKPVLEGNEKVKPGTVKRCVPVLDAVSQGYIIPLWADLQVKVYPMYHFLDEDGNDAGMSPTLSPEDLLGTSEEGSEVIRSFYKKTEELAVMMTFPESMQESEDMLERHGWDQVGEACTLSKFKFGKALFKFANPWVIETEPGYSVQFKNPSNNWENDICIIEGVVDTDEYYNNINFPYVWTGKEVGEFIIPQGTPLIHVIPFKREPHDYSIGVVDENKQIKLFNKMFKKHFNGYRTFFWHKRKIN